MTRFLAPSIDGIDLARLSEVDPEVIVRLMNHPMVRRQMPLARDTFDLTACSKFVQGKERMWEEHGFGPWAFLRDGHFVGWGGLQPEGDDVDVGLVLHPEAWGLGRKIYRMTLEFAFDHLGLESVIALLPPSRSRNGGLTRLGFEPDGEASIGGERFFRFRLRSQGRSIR